MINHVVDLLLLRSSVRLVKLIQLACGSHAVEIDISIE